MTTITLETARDELLDLIKRALDGEEIIITADGAHVRLLPQPVVKDSGGVELPTIVPINIEPFNEGLARKRGYGSMKGQFKVTDAFFEPLPEEELRAFEGRDDE